MTSVEVKRTSDFTSHSKYTMSQPPTPDEYAQMGAELEVEVAAFASLAIHNPVKEKCLTDKMVNTANVDLNFVKKCPEKIWVGPEDPARSIIHDDLLVERLQDLQSSHAKQDPSSPVGRTPAFRSSKESIRKCCSPAPPNYPRYENRAIRASYSTEGYSGIRPGPRTYSNCG